MVPDTFRNSRKIQVLNLARNGLMEIAPETFRNLGDLRVVDLSENLLRSLPDSLFISDDLEKLDISNNHLTKIPVTSLTNVAALKLCELDLSHNYIGAIHSMDLSNKFRVSDFYLCMLFEQMARFQSRYLHSDYQGLIYQIIDWRDLKMRLSQHYRILQFWISPTTWSLKFSVEYLLDLRRI